MEVSKNKNMDPMTDSHPVEELEYSPSLIIKEYFFLVIVVFMAITGLTLCVQKIYPSSNSDIEQILVHEAEFAQIDAGKAAQ